MPPKAEAETKSLQKSIRLTPQRVSQASHLGRTWSPVPLSLADVVSECIRRAYEAETKPKKKS